MAWQDTQIGFLSSKQAKNQALDHLVLLDLNFHLSDVCLMTSDTIRYNAIWVRVWMRAFIQSRFFLFKWVLGKRVWRFKKFKLVAVIARVSFVLCPEGRLQKKRGAQVLSLTTGQMVSDLYFDNRSFAKCAQNFFGKRVFFCIFYHLLLFSFVILSSCTPSSLLTHHILNQHFVLSFSLTLLFFYSIFIFSSVF